MQFKFKPYQLRVMSAWFGNLSAGYFASAFLILNQPWLLGLNILVSIVCLSISGIIERRLDKL